MSGRRVYEEDVSTVGRRISRPAPAWHARRLVVLEGPDAGKTWTIDPNAPGRVLVGTSEACAVRLTDPTVSRRHFAIEPVAGGCRIVDLESTNGVHAGDVAIRDAVVRERCVLRCGDTVLRVESDAAQASEVPEASSFGRVVGASLAMRRLYPLCTRLARANVPVVIEGETGTGKENLAEALHEVGGRAGPFVVFDCTTVAPSLVEAELFGHERGAFTGATSARAGVFEAAAGGTLLVDEIGDLDLPLQAKLLRAIDKGEIRRVGGQRSLRVDVRILAATRRDLDKEVAAGRFRDDLFHRLAIARVELPPLRERHGDVPLLARTFAREMGGDGALVSEEWLARRAAYAWPGNVRELRNAIARLLALGDDPLPDVDAPPAAGARDIVEALVASRTPFAIAKRRVVEDFERRYTEALLAEHDGNVTRAAQSSGIALRYFQLVKARANKP